MSGCVRLLLGNCWKPLDLDPTHRHSAPPDSRGHLRSKVGCRKRLNSLRDRSSYTYHWLQACAQKLDASTGASLKLTVLNPNGRVWIMIADSVMPSQQQASHMNSQTTVNTLVPQTRVKLSNMPRQPSTCSRAHLLALISDGKILIIGGITNFVNPLGTEVTILWKRSGNRRCVDIHFTGSALAVVLELAEQAMRFERSERHCNLQRTQHISEPVTLTGGVHCINPNVVYPCRQIKSQYSVVNSVLGTRY
ncbi:hypothetical protein BDR06DRAFT_967469 [Suillus hirtellus]|nr:hypothetical protein BDR06DRAFT_967469 [Suillus hirtellus]